MWLFPSATTAVGLLLAVGGFLLPDLTVREEAERRRANFRHALSAYLKLIRVLLAGGAGVDGALSDAVSIGHGWVFHLLRRALITAHITWTTPWAGSTRRRPVAASGRTRRRADATSCRRER